MGKMLHMQLEYPSLNKIEKVSKGIVVEVEKRHGKFGKTGINN